MRYLSINVLKTVGYPDCSNNGVSQTHPQKLVIECVDGNLSEENVLENGYIILKLEFTARGCKYFKPANVKNHLMFGGAFIYSSDSRFTRIHDYPVHVYDRTES